MSVDILRFTLAAINNPWLVSRINEVSSSNLYLVLVVFLPNDVRVGFGNLSMKATSAMRAHQLQLFVVFVRLRSHEIFLFMSVEWAANW